MALRHQCVDQRFVLRIEREVHRWQVVLPLRQRARAGDDRADGVMGQHPGGGKLGSADALLLGVLLHLLGNHEGFRAELGLQDAGILAAGGIYADLWDRQSGGFLGDDATTEEGKGKEVFFS